MRKANYLMVALTILAVSACQKGEVRNTLGLSKAAPDEFMVLSRPSLSVPPEFNLVKPSDKREIAVSNKVCLDARKAIIGDVKTVKSSGSESIILEKANIQSDENIRQTLLDEYQEQQEEEDSFVGSIRSIINNANGRGIDEILNADEEKIRLNKLKAQSAKQKFEEK